ncbi:MAG: aminopeptidase P family protein [Gammaproteobacteria bacterium]|nr:aminopeptidase P family protein [Gammaproteobacteria bacterium]
MNNGIGGSTAEIELKKLVNMTADIAPITINEYQQRIERAQQLMQQHNIAALYINAGTNLSYFTGTRWGSSERMVGAILPATGSLAYIAPWFEQSTLTEFMVIDAPVLSWQEHECPYQLTIKHLTSLNITQGTIALDESCSFFLADGLIKQAKTSGLDLAFTTSKPITAGCRAIKSSTEIALLQRAKDMTMEVHKAAARILAPGMMTTDMVSFINQAHIAVGASAGSYFCIVLFGEATAYPHGVKEPQSLKMNDMVLIDTGCQLLGYNSDITRTYVFGQASERQTQVWNDEKNAQAAGFNAAQLGSQCQNVDFAARSYLEQQGYGPGYQVPGLPHRTGHGIGLDIHEWPYLVKGDTTILEPGMCFSNEPMICIYGEFGVRHEDHFYMTATGPKWFTQPATSIDNPFGY